MFKYEGKRPLQNIDYAHEQEVFLEELSFGERATIGIAQNFDVSSTLIPLDMK